MGTSDQVAAAHARLLRDPSLQFSFGAVTPPPPPPGWLVSLLRAVGQALIAAGPVLKWVFWGVLAAGAVAVLAFVVREVWLYRKPRAGGGRVSLSGAEAEWRPDARRARALLADADRLAAEGRFAEAAHVLLHRSIDDIEGRRPDLIAPSLTARDIARLGALPDAARTAFGRIAGIVEQSLFGGRPLDGEGWLACREAYDRFAFPQAWAPPS